MSSHSFLFLKTTFQVLGKSLCLCTAAMNTNLLPEAQKTYKKLLFLQAEWKMEPPLPLHLPL